MCVFMVLLMLSTSVTANDNGTQHNYYWKDYTGTVPKDAFHVIANLYIGQVYFEGILPGTFYPEKMEAITQYRGLKRVVKNPIKLLCAMNRQNFAWEYVNVDSLTGNKLNNLVIGGFEQGSVLYIGKTFHEGKWKIGKVFPPTNDYKGLQVWNKLDTVHGTAEFEILKYFGNKTFPFPDVYWREYMDGVIPPDAIPGGEGLYIGQISVNGILPATVYPDKKTAISEYLNKTVEAQVGVKILCSNYPDNFYWEYVNVGSLTSENLKNLVRGGIEGEQILYIGKTFHDGAWKIGRVYPAEHQLRGLIIWTTSGTAHSAPDFQVLKYIDRQSDYVN